MLNRLILWAIYATILTLPWYVVRSHVAGIPVTLPECMALATITLWLLHEAIRLYRTGANLYFNRFISSVKQYKLIIALCLLFLASSTVSIFISTNVIAALGIYKAYILEPLLLCLIIVSVVNTQERIWVLLWCVILSATQVSLLAISQFMLGWPNFAPHELIQGRSSAMYNTANAVGLYVGPVSLLALALAWKNNIHMSIRSGLFLATLLGFIAIILSRSDGALIAFVGSIIIAAILWCSKKWNNIGRQAASYLIGAGVVAYAMITITFMWWMNHPPHVANPYTRPGFSTFTVRQCTWEGTTKLLQQNPISGSGLASFSTTYLNYATCDAEPLVYPHNLILNFWVETGLLGMLSMVGIVIIWLNMASELYLRSKNYSLVGLGILLAITYWFIHGIVDVPYFKNDLSMLWWVLVGIGLTATNIQLANAANKTNQLLSKGRL